MVPPCPATLGPIERQRVENSPAWIRTRAAARPVRADRFRRGLLTKPSKSDGGQRYERYIESFGRALFHRHEIRLTKSADGKNARETL